MSVDSAATAGNAADSHSAAHTNTSAASPSTHPLTNDASSNSNATLQQFLLRPGVKQRYADAIDTFTAARNELHTMEASLAKFTKVCNSHPPSIRLPSSMQLNIVKRAQLPAVTSDPSFHSAASAELQRIESETSSQIYEILLKAKTKHVEHLRSQCNAHSFAFRILESHRQFVTEFASEYDRNFGIQSHAAASSAATTPAHSAFPLDAAVTHFRDYLNEQLVRLVMLGVEELNADRERRKAAAAAEYAAQEQTLAGAHTGETISLLANRAVDRRLAPIKQQLTQLQHQQHCPQNAPQQRGAVPNRLAAVPTHPISSPRPRNSGSVPSVRPNSTGPPGNTNSNRKRDRSQTAHSPTVTNSRDTDRTVISHGDHRHSVKRYRSNEDDKQQQQSASKKVQGGGRYNVRNGPARPQFRLPLNIGPKPHSSNQGREGSSSTTTPTPSTRR